jgi:hypothetical protein
MDDPSRNAGFAGLGGAFELAPRDPSPIGFRLRIEHIRN